MFCVESCAPRKGEGALFRESRFVIAVSQKRRWHAPGMDSLEFKMTNESQEQHEEALAKKARIQTVSRIIAGVVFVFFAIKLMVIFAG